MSNNQELPPYDPNDPDDPFNWDWDDDTSSPQFQQPQPPVPPPTPPPLRPNLQPDIKPGQESYWQGFDFFAQDSNEPSYSWLAAWRLAITKPTVKTYEALMKDPQRSTDRAWLWLAVSLCVAMFFYVLAQAVYTEIFGADSIVTSAYVAPSSAGGNPTGATTVVQSGEDSNLLVNFLCLLPMFVIGNSLIISFVFIIIHVVARIFGGEASLGSTLYALSLPTAPYLMISGGLSLIPGGTYLAVIAVLYLLYLHTVALRVSHNLPWGESFLAAMAPFGVLFGCFCLCFSLLVSSVGITF